MSTRSACRRSLAVLLAVLVLTSAACSAIGQPRSEVSSAVVDHFKGLPKGVQPRVGGGPDGELPWAAWAGPHTIYVMTWGSGSCPRIPTSVDARSAEVVVIRTVEHDFVQGDQACTADLAVTTSVVRVPARADAARSLQVKIDGTTTRLPASAS